MTTVGNTAVLLSRPNRWTGPRTGTVDDSDDTEVSVLAIRTMLPSVPVVLVREALERHGSDDAALEALLTSAGAVVAPAAPTASYSAPRGPSAVVAPAAPTASYSAPPRETAAKTPAPEQEPPSWLPMARSSGPPGLENASRYEIQTERLMKAMGPAPVHSFAAPMQEKGKDKGKGKGKGGG